MAAYKGDTGLWRGVARLDLKKVHEPQISPAPADKRSAGMDRNVVGDSSGMSKATRLQKSRRTKELICELTRTQERNQSEALEQVNEHERLRWCRGGGGRNFLRELPRSCCCMQKNMCSQGQRVFLCAFMLMCLAVRACARVCVCVRAPKLPHCVHSSFVESGASFSLTFSIWPPEESYDN